METINYETMQACQVLENPKREIWGRLFWVICIHPGLSNLAGFHCTVCEKDPYQAPDTLSPSLFSSVYRRRISIDDFFSLKRGPSKTGFAMNIQ